MKQNKATAAIRAINPAIFRGLHVKMGFDFEQAITIKRIDAPFTVAKAWKLADMHEPEIISPTTHAAALIMRIKDAYYTHAYMVPLKADDIRDDYDKASYYEYDRDGRYNLIFDDYLRKGDFNAARKKATTEAYIITQRKDLLKPWHEPARDWTQRQTDMKPGEHPQHCRIYYGNRRPTISIDRSNYRADLKRDDLKRRAAKLRAERAKAAADAATQATAASRYNDLLKAFSAAKQRIITALVNVDPLTLCPAAVTNLEDIGKSIGEYAWKGLSGAARDINEFAAATRENKFTSPARYDAAYNEIIKKLAAILPEDDGTAKEAV